MISRDELVAKFVDQLAALIAKPIREVNGHNRSPEIDAWNSTVHADMGAPYCASSVWCEWNKLCVKLGLKFPMPKTASSQAFDKKVPIQYHRAPGVKGKKGDQAVLRLPKNPSQGHLVTLREDQVQEKLFKTHEFNTSSHGSRDGEGGFSLIRSTVDQSIENYGKDFVCFVDIPQWILDANAGAPQHTPDQPDDKGTVPWYVSRYAACTLTPEFAKDVARDAKQVLSGKDRYEKVAKLTGIPWYVIGGIHFKEASCDFDGCLHNGEKIIGTGKKTTIVPIGRGPFATWEDSAVDALKGELLGKLHEFDIGHLLFCVERYNGSGYLTGAGKSQNSPYLWARTNINSGKGKYVRDGKYDPDAVTTKTSGFCAILKWLEQNKFIKID